MKKIKKLLTSSIDYLFQIKRFQHYKNQYKRYAEYQENTPLRLDLLSVDLQYEKETKRIFQEYKQKWSVFTKRIEPYTLEVYLKFMGPTTEMIPEHIFEGYIMPKLNPKRYVSFYNDKNLYPSYLWEEVNPQTLICRINGSKFLDKNFHPISSDYLSYLNQTYPKIDKFILKPTQDTSQGSGVMLFLKKDCNKKTLWVSHDGKITLSDEFLRTYGDNWVIQEAVNQHSFLSQFCDTSVNTFRICTYRSVIDEKVSVTSAVLRIGQSGAICDNGSIGGRFVGINVITGKLNHYVSDKKGFITDKWNNIDFVNNNFTIPNWDKVLEFAKSIGEKNHHLRALGLDVTLDKNGSPILLEYNTGNFSPWLFQFSGQRIFGDYLDEIIDFCKNE